MALGLVHNTALPVSSLMICAYGLASESLPRLSGKKQQQSNMPKDPRLRPPSVYLLPTNPSRTGKKATSSKTTNAHVLVEFGLHLLDLCLKRERLSGTNVEHLQMLDPFVQVFVDALASKHVRITTLALRCLCWVLRYDLPSLKQNINKIVENLFVLLKNYAVAGAAKGDNFELVVTCFKAITVVVRDVKYHTISTDQLQVLLTYAEQDIHDFTRRSTAFGLLKAIIGRKLLVSEIHDVMSKVNNMAVQSEAKHVQEQCRQVCLQYLLDYPLGRKLKKSLQFWLTQLHYEHEGGRESVLHMLTSMCDAFPQTTIHEFSGMLFVPIASNLVNDESPKCRKMTDAVLKRLLNKIDTNHLDSLFSMVTVWMQDNKASVQRLGAQLCGIFVVVEGNKFERHLETVLPILAHQILPDKYTEEVEDSTKKMQDHLLFNMLSTLAKILQNCSVLQNSKYVTEFIIIWKAVKQHLLHAHDWVRLVAAQLFGFLFATWDPVELSRQIMSTNHHSKQAEAKKTTADEYLAVKTHDKLHKLAMCFCSQLQSQNLDEEMGNQVQIISKSTYFKLHFQIKTEIK